jgi:hypothetical protein
MLYWFENRSKFEGEKLSEKLSDEMEFHKIDPREDVRFFPTGDFLPSEGWGININKSMRLSLFFYEEDVAALLCVSYTHVLVVRRSFLVKKNFHISLFNLLRLLLTSRATRGVEKNRPKCCPAHFCQHFLHNFYLGKRVLQIFGLHQ